MRNVLLMVALLAGCGGRSNVGIPPGVKLDHSVITPDRSLPRYDGSVWPGLEWGVLPDAIVYPVDKAKPDKPKPFPDKSLPDKSCLPVPAGTIAGGYSGQWKGTFSCLPNLTVIGDLKFTLTSIGSNMFQVSGSFVGSMSIFSLNSSIGGAMTCTTFGGSLPSVSVSGTPFIGMGSMSSQLTLSAAGTPSFPTGTWTINQTSGGICTGNGTWYANKQ